MSQVVNFAAGNDRTVDVLAKIQTIISGKPKIIFLSIGSNDKRAGVSNSVWFTNYKLITSQLIAAGIPVYHLLTFPENGFDFTAYVDSIIATYPTTYIDTWNPLRTGTNINTTYNSDGVHFNTLGHSVVAKQIIKSGLLDQFISYKAKPYFEVPLSLGGGDVLTNVAIGLQSLSSNLLGVQSTAIGYNVLTKATADYNTAIGYQSLFSATTGHSLTAIGVNSLRSNTTGAQNTAIGVNALYTNTSASGTTGVGMNALYSNLTGGFNTAIGYDAYRTNSTGSFGVAIGYEAMKMNTSDYNTAMGYQALKTSTGTRNTIMGSVAVPTAASGDFNTVMGCLGGFNLSSG